MAACSKWAGLLFIGKPLMGRPANRQQALDGLARLDEVGQVWAGPSRLNRPNLAQQKIQRPDPLRGRGP